MNPPTTHEYVSLDSTTFAPVDYNRTYYSEVMEDEAALIRWQATTLDKRIKAHLHSTSQRHFTSLREAGSGPAVHHLFALEKYVDTIHLSDFLPANLEEIRRWVDHEDHTHDWRPFVAATLDAEGIEVGDGDIETRQESVRAKILSLSRIDLKRGTGIGPGYTAPFVSSFFVADSATASHNEFGVMTANAFSLVDPGGLFVAAYLGGCEAYRVGERWLVSAQLSEFDIESALVACGATDLEITRFDTPAMAEEGFDHLFTAVAAAPAR